MWPEPYFKLDPSPASTLKLRQSFSGVTLSGNRAGLEWKYGTLLIGEESRIWFRKADRTALYQLVVYWGDRKPELHASAFRFHPRVDLFLEPYSKQPEFVLYFADQNSAQTCFRGMVALQRFAPMVVPGQQSIIPTAAATTATVIKGVGFIESKQRELIKQESTLALEAFSGDLKELQSRANVVLDLVRKCADELATSGRAEEDRDAFDTLLADIGLVNNPVTKQNSGKRYHQELSRQIQDFLHTRNEVVISLPDVFALYNRARGGNALVSPTDLQLACELMTNSSNGANSEALLEYWEFKHSGVKCLRNKLLNGSWSKNKALVWCGM
ncbi:hypothetical protein BASA81_015371 [Batrachochytrium salamandrivorans]|nr:hypothetical protein BASA81_015371 [Batrachochytrium salamandrivorans]